MCLVLRESKMPTPISLITSLLCSCAVPSAEVFVVALCPIQFYTTLVFVAEATQFILNSFTDNKLTPHALSCLEFICQTRFNLAKPKTDVEARVYEVLSHKNWGASTTLMNEIAQDTFDYEKCKP